MRGEKWGADYGTVLSDNGDVVADGLTMDDANLIAAAPELYASLAELQAWITDGGNEDDPDVAYMCGSARAALAKARGEQQ